MKIMKRIFCMLFCVFLVMTVMAQNAEPDSMPMHPDQLRQDSVNRDSLEVPPVTIDMLQDSIAILRERIRQLDLRQKEMLRQIAFADTCIVRQCNNALNAPYDEKRTRSAILAFDRISSPAYRHQMMPLRQLLVDYASHYTELMGILHRADADRDMRNPFGGKETAERYIDEICQTSYYRNVMQKEWVIPFMNRLVQMAINRLKANNPGERQSANLKELLTP